MSDWVPTVCMVLLSGYLLFRIYVVRRRQTRCATRDDIFQVQQNLTSPVSKIHQMESRLYDYGREVEGRVETTLNILDRLIIDAQKESDRLEHLLKQIRENKAA